MRIVVLVSGSGTLLQAIIDASSLEKNNIQIVAVGADRDCTGLNRAQKAGIETFILNPKNYADRTEWNSELNNKLQSYHPDYVVFAGFMRIVDSQVVNEFERKIINTHPALLPSFPGAHGVRDAMAYGVKITGTTVHFVDSGVDTGEILDQVAVPIFEDDTEEVLHERIKVQERQLIVKTLLKLAQSNAGSMENTIP